MKQFWLWMKEPGTDVDFPADALNRPNMVRDFVVVILFIVACVSILYIILECPNTVNTIIRRYHLLK